MGRAISLPPLCSCMACYRVTCTLQIYFSRSHSTIYFLGLQNSFNKTVTITDIEVRNGTRVDCFNLKPHVNLKHEAQSRRRIRTNISVTWVCSTNCWPTTLRLVAVLVSSISWVNIRQTCSSLQVLFYRHSPADAEHHVHYLRTYFPIKQNNTTWNNWLPENEICRDYIWEQIQQFCYNNINNQLDVTITV